MDTAPRRGGGLAAAPEANDDIVNYAAQLLAASQRAGLRKSEATRLRLLASMARRLDGDAPSSSLRVTDIVERVCAHGTFYRYFTDIPAALEDLLSGFVEHLTHGMSEARSGEAASPERVRAATLAYVKLFRANAGLMRCLMAVDPGGSHARSRYLALNKEWNGRVARALAAKQAHSSGEADLPASAFLMRAYALGGMVDEFLANLYLRGDPVLQELAGSEEVVADLLTSVWCGGAAGGAQWPRRTEHRAEAGPAGKANGPDHARA